MSRIAKAPVDLPKGVTATVSPESVTIKGAKGTLSVPLTRGVSVVQTDSKLEIKYTDPGLSRTQAGSIRAQSRQHGCGRHQGLRAQARARWSGFPRTGYGQELEPHPGLLASGHLPIPEGITMETPSQTEIVIKGIDRQKVGQIAAEIRDVRPPEPYKGKGVKYAARRSPSKRGKRNDYYEEAAAHAPRYQDAGAHSSLGVARLTIHRTPQHIYAQVTGADGAKVIAAASTVQEKSPGRPQGHWQRRAAKAVGRAIAERTKAAGVSRVAFDRAGFSTTGV